MRAAASLALREPGIACRARRSTRSGFCDRRDHGCHAPLRYGRPTAIALAIGGALALLFPLAIVALYLLTLPVALVLLWAGRDAEAPIDCILAVDAQRAQERRSAAREKPALAKAA